MIFVSVLSHLSQLVLQFPENLQQKAGTAQREGLGGEALAPPFFARIKINQTKSNLSKVTE